MSEVEKYYEVEQAVAEVVQEEAKDPVKKLFNDDKTIVTNLMSKVLRRATTYYSSALLIADTIDINALLSDLNKIMSEDLTDILDNCRPAYLVHEGELKLVDMGNKTILASLGKDPTQAQVLDSYLELMTGIAKSYKLV